MKYKKFRFTKKKHLSYPRIQQIWRLKRFMFWKHHKVHVSKTIGWVIVSETDFNAEIELSHRMRCYARRHYVRTNRNTGQ